MKIKIFKFLTVVVFAHNSLHSVSGPMYSEDGKYLGYLVDDGIYKKHLYEGAVYKHAFTEAIVHLGDADLYSNDVLFDVSTLKSVGAILINGEARQYIINATHGSLALYGKDIRRIFEKYIKEEKCKKQTPLYPKRTNEVKHQPLLEPLFPRRCVKKLESNEENDCYCNFKSFMNMMCYADEQFVKLSHLHPHNYNS